MKKILKNNYFLLLSGFPLVITFLFLQINIPIWDETTQKALFNSVFLYSIALILCWIYLHHASLFERGEWLRNIITIVGSGIVLLWTYKHKITFRLDILLFFLCALYGIVHRNFIKPSLSILLFLLFILIKMIGLFWAKDFDYGVKTLFEGENIIFSLLIPIVLLGFSVSKKQQESFIAICFKGFLLLLVVNLIFYSFAISADKNQHFFNFITLNKAYFSYYETLFWSKFKHPSFISWIILVIGGLGGLLWRKDKKLISTPELITYGILVLCFALIVQARVVIISWFIVVAFFVYLFIEKYLSRAIKYSLFTLLGIITIGGVCYLVTHTTYFSDPIRNEIYTKAFAAIEKGNLWIGNGSGYQRYIMKELFIGYVHNDFVAIIIDTGLVGLGVFIGWLITIVFSKDILKQYLLLVFLPIMNTDVLFHAFECGYLLVPLMIFILLAPRFKYWQG